MKQLLTILFIAVSFAAFAQPGRIKFSVDPYNFKINKDTTKSLNLAAASPLYFLNDSTISMQPYFTVAKNATRDSVIFTFFDGTRVAIKDSVGTGGGGGGGITGSSVINRVTYWDQTSNITGDTSFRFNPIGVVAKTKVEAGVAIKNIPTALANTDTIVGMDITQFLNSAGFTGVKKYTFKIGNQFVYYDSLSNIIMGNGSATVVTTNGNTFFAGLDAGKGATNSYHSVFIGNSAGLNATTSSSSNFIGWGAGSGATTAYNSNFFGQSAGLATNAYQSNFFGVNAGSSATNAYSSNFFGYNTGLSATNANGSNFYGYETGGSATNASFSNFFGYRAGKGATSASNSIFIGQRSGFYATGASSSIFIGFQTGDSIQHKITGANNMVIGNNITTPAAASVNTLNIGGSIFGTGMYSTTTGSPYKYAVLTAKIGIDTTAPNSSLHITGSLAVTNVTKTGNYTATATDNIIFVDATSGNITITLPAATGIEGRYYTIKKIDASANTVTIDGNASETIDGATTVVLTTQYSGKQINAITAAWYIVGSF